MAEAIVWTMVFFQILAATLYSIEGDFSRAAYWSGACILTTATVFIK